MTYTPVYNSQPFTEIEKVRALSAGSDTDLLTDYEIERFLMEYASLESDKKRVLLAAADACDYLASQSGQWDSVNIEGQVVSKNLLPARAADYRKRVVNLNLFIR